MKTVCFRLPETLVKSIDELAQKLGYTSKTALLRDALKALVREKEEKVREMVREVQISKKPMKSRVIEEIKVLEVL